MEVSIYLESHKLDLNEQSVVALTLCYSYLSDPTTIAGDYSKSIKVPGTVNNNNIFGQIWKLDREQLFGSNNTQVYFNPSKKTECKIYLGNDIFKIGYVQLNKISREKGVISYDITFYSELCNVLHDLLDSSLCDVSNQLGHTVNANFVESNVRHYSSNYLSDNMLYGLDNNGVYDNFNASKWVTLDSSGNYVVADVTPSGQNFDSAMIKEVEASRLRPYLKVKPLINQIIEGFNRNSEYKLSLHGSFFNINNPYYMNTVMSGRLYDTDNEAVVDSNIDGYNKTMVFDVNNYIASPLRFESTSNLIDEDGYINFDTFRGQSTIDFEAQIRFRCDVNQSQFNTAIGTSTYYSRYYTGNSEYRWNVKLYQVDEDGNETGTVEYLQPYKYFYDYTYRGPAGDNGIDTSRALSEHQSEVVSACFNECVDKRPQMALMIPNRCVTGESWSYCQEYDPWTGQYNYNTICYYDTIERIYSDLSCGWNYNETDFWPIHFYGNAKARTGRWKVKFELEDAPTKLDVYIYNSKKSTIDITRHYIDIKLSSKTGTIPGNIPVNNLSYKNTAPLQSLRVSQGAERQFGFKPFSGASLKLSANSGISTGAYVTIKDMIDSDVTQGAFLTSYTKMFGLVYDTDTVNTSKSISIKTRNKYHENYKILDWTDKIDYAQTYSANPLTFDTRYLTLNFNPRESYYEKKYLSKYGTDYAIQKIDTGYDFNDNSKPILENQLFGSTIMVKGEALFNDCPVASFFDKESGERSPIDGAYSMLFMDDYIYGPNWSDPITEEGKKSSIEVNIFDSNEYMHNEEIGGSVDQDCWLDVSTFTAQSKGTNLFRKLYLNCPTTVKQFNDITFSLDMGYPRANYAKYGTSFYPSSQTVYSLFWKSYIADLYDVNTKVLTCFVNLTPVDILNFTFKDFVKIDDTLWHPNKIIDYNPLSKKPVKVELVKVNDISNYTDGQYKFPETFTVTYTTSGCNKVSGPTTVDGETDFIAVFSYNTGYSLISAAHVYMTDDNGVTRDYADQYFDSEHMTITIPAEEIKSDIQIQIIAALTPKKYYNVTYQLSGCTLSMIRPASQTLVTSIEENTPFHVGINPSSGYTETFAKVTMGGNDITSTAFSNPTTIIIESVDGDLNVSLTYEDLNDKLLPWIANGDGSNLNTRKSVWFDTGISPDSSTSIEIRTSVAQSFRSADDHQASSMGVQNTSWNGLALQFPVSGTTADSAIRINSTYYNTSIDDYDRLTPGTDYRFKGGIAVYDLQYTHPSAVNKRTQFYSIDDATYVNTTAANIASGLGSMYVLGRRTSSGVSNLGWDGTKVYNAKVFKSGKCVSNLQPVLRYSTGKGWVPCMWDSITNSYLTNNGTDTPYYDLSSTEDISISYIGNGLANADYSNRGTCFVEIPSQSISGGRIELLASIPSNTAAKSYYFFTCKTTYSGKDVYNTLYFNGSSKYTVGDFGYSTSASARVTATISTTVSANTVHTFGVRCLSSSLAVYMDGQTKSSSNTPSSYGGIAPIQLFREPGGSYTYAGVKVYGFRMVKENYADEGSQDFTLVPVLHYTGTPNTYISDEGMRVPAGYEPCFYCLTNGNYIYPQGNPTFGFYK